MTEPGSNEPQPPYGQEPPAPYGQQPPPSYEPPSYEPPAHQTPQPPQAPPPPGYANYGAQPAPGAPYGMPMAQPGAPWGVHPVTGVPYSDKQKLVAGLLQIFLGGFGIGRFYIGDSKTAVLQIIVTVLTCGIGSIWGLIDGILMLTGDPTDAQGRPLRPN